MLLKIFAKRATGGAFANQGEGFGNTYDFYYEAKEIIKDHNVEQDSESIHFTLYDEVFDSESVKDNIPFRSVGLLKRYQGYELYTNSGALVEKFVEIYPDEIKREVETV